MKKGWYILNYHDISWEPNVFIAGINESLRPDVFRDHVAALAQHFDLVSVRDGWQRWIIGDFDRPIVSFWFDDGYASVRRNALPILEEFGVKAAMSVSSSFMLREQLFWRVKLSYIGATDGLKVLRPRLRELGMRVGDDVGEATLLQCSAEIVDAIDTVYMELTTDDVREDALGLFDDLAGIRALLDQGWEIANHTAAHFPVSDTAPQFGFDEQFGRCEAVLNHELNVQTRFWVYPFGRPFSRARAHQGRFEATDMADRILVYGSSKVNQKHAKHPRQLARIGVPMAGADQLLAKLSKLGIYRGL